MSYIMFLPQMLMSFSMSLFVCFGLSFFYYCTRYLVFFFVCFFVVFLVLLISVWCLHVILLFVWVSSRFSSFLPRSKDIHVRLIGGSKLPVGVTV